MDPHTSEQLQSFQLLQMILKLPWHDQVTLFM